MPRFFTHLENHYGLQCDETGVEFADAEHALRRAGETAGAVLAEDLVAGRSPVRIVLRVEDKDGTACGTIEVASHMTRHGATDQPAGLA